MPVIERSREHWPLDRGHPSADCAVLCDVPRHCRSKICHGGCGLGFGLERFKLLVLSSRDLARRQNLIDFGREHWQLVFIWIKWTTVRYEWQGASTLPLWRLRRSHWHLREASRLSFGRLARVPRQPVAYQADFYSTSRFFVMSLARFEPVESRPSPEDPPARSGICALAAQVTLSR
jgi:hypothetical protein